MLRSLKHQPEHDEALARVCAWTRLRFKLPEDAVIMVSEMSCALPGCPPLETVVVFWTDDARRHQFKLFKRVAEVVESDLPPAFMKAALAAAADMGFECC